MNAKRQPIRLSIIAFNAIMYMEGPSPIVNFGQMEVLRMGSYYELLRERSRKF